jgi:hypothetical protein
MMLWVGPISFEHLAQMRPGAGSGTRGARGLPCRADAGHVRQVAIGLEHDILPPLDGLLAEGAPDLVGHVPKRYGGRFSERKSRPRRPRSRQPHVCKSGIVGLVDSPGHARAAVARHPHDSPLDAGVQIAAQPVLGEEGVHVCQQAHGPGAYRNRAMSATIR